MVGRRALSVGHLLAGMIALSALACGAEDTARTEGQADAHQMNTPRDSGPLEDADGGLVEDAGGDGVVEDGGRPVPAPNGVGEVGTPSDAAELAPGTSCESFSHVAHLPWDERPPACPTGDWCMKKDDGPYEGASTWYGFPSASRFMTITCKIRNRCLRFVGMNNCHYDLYDPDSNITVEPSDEVAWARKDGHSYSNFRVRLPGSDVIYNFMSRTIEARDDPREATYCPADAFVPEGAEPVDFDPNQGDQTKGCGAEGSMLHRFGDDRGAIPYDVEGRTEYDWIYQQDGEE